MAKRIIIERKSYICPNFNEISLGVHNTKERDLLLKTFEALQKEVASDFQTRENIAKTVYLRGCELYERKPQQAITAYRLLTYAIWNAPEQSEYLILTIKKRFEILLALKLYPQALSDYEDIILIDKKMDDHIRTQVLEYQKQPIQTANESRLRLFEQLNVIPKHGLGHIAHNIVEFSLIPEHIELLRFGMMSTSKDILQGEEIFKEAPFAIYPIDPKKAAICNNCGTSQFVPVSCFKCFGSVLYCSTQCKNQHYNVHQYECPLYRNGMNKHFRKWDLFALRILITGLPTIASMLQSKQNMHELWMVLLCDLLPTQCNAYLNVIKMRTKTKGSEKEVQIDTKNSVRLSLYLRHKTDFYKVFKKRNGVKELEAFIGNVLNIVIH